MTHGRRVSISPIAAVWCILACADSSAERADFVDEDELVDHVVALTEALSADSLVLEHIVVVNANHCLGCQDIGFSLRATVRPEATAWAVPGPDSLIVAEYARQERLTNRFVLVQGEEWISAIARLHQPIVVELGKQATWRFLNDIRE